MALHFFETLTQTIKISVFLIIRPHKTFRHERYRRKRFCQATYGLPPNISTSVMESERRELHETLTNK